MNGAVSAVLSFATGLYGQTILSGVFFGLWPIFMNRTGLAGTVQSVCFSAMVAIGVLPFAIRSVGASITGPGYIAIGSAAILLWIGLAPFMAKSGVPESNAVMLILGGITGACGMFFFTGMLAGATVAQYGGLFVLTTVVQITIAAAYNTVMNGGITIGQAGGFVAAAVAAYLLLRS